MAIVNFYATTAEKYAALDSPNSSCLYFLDDGRLYKGSTLMGSNIQIVTSFPAVGEIGKIYYKASTGNAKIWAGHDYFDLTKENITAITKDSTNFQTPTAKAVWDLVAAAVPSDYSQLQGVVAGHTEALRDINNTRTGILAKATALIKALEEGAVQTNTDNIGKLNREKADKATTLAGYGIEDAYTKGEVDSAISTAVSSAGLLKREIVQVLPSVSEADKDTIYMVKDTSSSNQSDMFKEYMIVGDFFECIGDTKVDLSNFYTKGETDKQISDAKTAMAADAKTKVDAAEKAVTDALNEYKKITNGNIAANAEAIEIINSPEFGILKQAKDYADSLGGIPDVDKSKLDTALQPGDIKTGETVAGSINVKGQDIIVMGLKSAAFTESSDYDPSGAALNAFNAAKEFSTGLVTWKSL